VPQPIKRVEVRESNSVVKLGYIMESSGKRRQFAIPNSRGQDSFAETQPGTCLYDQLKSMDFEAVRGVIAVQKGILPAGQTFALYSALEAMEKSDSDLFLNPYFLAQKVKNIPFALFNRICENACLLEIAHSVDRLEYIPPGIASDPLKRIQYALDINYVIPSLELFEHFAGRSPRSLQEKAEFIRWVVRKYDAKYRPEFILETEEEKEGKLLDHKEFPVENVSFNFNRIDKVPSQEILDILHNQSSVNFGVLLSRFSIIFAGVVSNFVYYPRKNNRKSAKIIPKIDEALVMQDVY